MDKLIQKHYPRSLECTVIKHHPISPQVLEMLREEITDSDYASFVSPQYLSQCDVHEVHQTPHCTVHIVSPHADVPPLLLIRRTMRRIECLMSIYGISKKKHLTFWLLPTSHLRKFPKKSDVQITPEHINGGFTYTHSRAGTVFVFRREEFPKVFLHETLHHAHMDTHSAWSKADLQKIYAYFRLDTKGCNPSMQCTSTDLRPNEAWIETWAELYHLGFLHYEYSLPWDLLWNAERKWACTQAKRVLLHQKAQQDGKWREQTHAYSYMVLRAALLWSAPKVLSTFHQVHQHINTSKLAQFMIACFEDASFQKCLHNTVLPSHTCFRMTVFGDL
jgi:hypothetical protein